MNTVAAPSPTGIVPAQQAVHLDHEHCVRGFAHCGTRALLRFQELVDPLFSSGNPEHTNGHNNGWARGYRQELEDRLPGIIEELAILRNVPEGFHCLSRAVLAVTFRNTIDSPDFFRAAAAMGEHMLRDPQALKNINIKDLGQFVYGLFNVGYCSKLIIEAAVNLVRSRDDQIQRLIDGKHCLGSNRGDRNISELLDGLSRIAWVACALNCGGKLFHTWMDPNRLGMQKAFPPWAATRVLQTHLSLAHVEPENAERRICGCPKPDSLVAQAWCDEDDKRLRERLLAHSRAHRAGNHQRTPFEHDIEDALHDLGPKNVVMIVTEPHLLEFDVDFSLGFKLHRSGREYLVPLALEADGPHHFVGWEDGNRPVMRNQVEDRMLARYAIAPVRVDFRDWRRRSPAQRNEYLLDRFHSTAQAYVKRWVG